MKALSTAVLMTLVITSGCAIYRPKTAIPGNYSKQVIGDVASPTLLKDYNALPQMNSEQQRTKVARRNQILSEVIYLIDQNYYKFESKFYGSEATFSTAMEAANLGFTAAGSITGTSEIKSILAATATGTTGFKSSVEKNFFDQQSRAAIVNKMRALRATQLALIQDGDHMKAGVTAYSLEQGISDVNDYYDAGTVVAALQSISQTAGKESADAAEKQKTNSSKSQSFQ